VGTSVNCNGENGKGKKKNGGIRNHGTRGSLPGTELTDAGCHVGPGLLVAPGTSVAGQSGDALLAGTLAT